MKERKMTSCMREGLGSSDPYTSSAHLKETRRRGQVEVGESSWSGGVTSHIRVAVWMAGTWVIPRCIPTRIRGGAYSRSIGLLCHYFVMVCGAESSDHSADRCMQERKRCVCVCVWRRASMSKGGRRCSIRPLLLGAVKAERIGLFWCVRSSSPPPPHRT